MALLKLGELIIDSAVILRFKSYLPTQREPNQCWAWRGNRDKDGYGVLSVKGRYQKASRLSHTIFKGPIPPYMLVCHTCDNPICVNPAHLFLGTSKDNVHDMVKKGRNYKLPKATSETVAKGAQHYRTKLTEAQALEIRKRSAAGQTVLRIASEMKLRYSQVYPVVVGRTWKILAAK